MMKAAKIDSNLIQFYSGTNSPVHFLLSVHINLFFNSKLLTKMQIVVNCDFEKILDNSQSLEPRTFMHN